MSRGNIISIVPDISTLLEPESLLFGGGGIIVTFQAHSGVRSYRYSGIAADAILAGDDPAHWAGEKV